MEHAPPDLGREGWDFLLVCPYNRPYHEEGAAQGLLAEVMAIIYAQYRTEVVVKPSEDKYLMYFRHR